MKLPARWLVLGGFALAGCGHDSVGPTGGALNLNFTTPNTDDGAILFTVSGGGVDSIVGLNDQIYEARPASNQLQVIVTGNLQNGPIARMYVSDSRLSGKYSATILQVAARTSYTQRDPAAYSLRVAP
jgi:hypothetical protein